MLGACLAQPAPPARCERGRARDIDDGTCASAAEVRAIARIGGAFVGDDDRVVCAAPSDELLVRRATRKLACVARPVPTRCGPGTVAATIRGGRDKKEREEREEREEEEACVPVMAADGVLDAGRFAAAAAALVCDAAARAPSGLGAPDATLEVALALHVPNNDPTLASASARVVPPAAEADLAPALGLVIDAMRQVGGASSAADVFRTVRCRRASRAPALEPATEDDARDVSQSP